MDRYGTYQTQLYVPSTTLSLMSCELCHMSFFIIAMLTIVGAFDSFVNGDESIGCVAKK